jgi:dTDP-4-dehydrorhamnose 3,5-epimerase
MSIIISKTKLENVLLIEPSIFNDHRGTYVETYNIEDYKKNDITIEFVRDDISTSSKNVLRGIHYDDKTWKLIQCMYGKIYFVVVDMRVDSADYLKWQSFTLSSSNRHQVLVPPNFGNGHLVLSESCIFHYKMSEYYDPDNERGLKWDDPKVGIDWLIQKPILSIKDSNTEYLK